MNLLIPGPLDENLLYAASGAVVDTTVVAGRVVMAGGCVDGADEVYDEVRRRARRVRGE